MKKGEILATPVDAEEVIETVGGEDHLMSDDSLEVGIKIADAGIIIREVKIEVEEMSCQETIKLLKIFPSPVNKPLCWHSILGWLKIKLYSE